MATGARFFSFLTKGTFLSLALVVLAFSLGYGLVVKSMPFASDRDLPGTLAVPTIEVHVSRLFPSSPEVIWTALTDPQIMSCWWAPKGYSVESVRFEARAQGEYEIRFLDPSHGRHVTRGQILIYNPMKRLKFSELDFDQDGDDLVVEFEGQAVTVEQTLTPLPAGTKLDVYVTGPFSEDVAPMIENAWSQSLDKLDLCVRGTEGPQESQ